MQVPNTFQTRSEENGIQYHSSLEDAMNAAERDTTIWKVSYSNSDNRVRLIRQENGTWKNEPFPYELFEALAKQGNSDDRKS